MKVQFILIQQSRPKTTCAGRRYNARPPLRILSTEILFDKNLDGINTQKGLELPMTSSITIVVDTRQNKSIAGYFNLILSVVYF